MFPLLIGLGEVGQRHYFYQEYFYNLSRKSQPQRRSGFLICLPGSDPRSLFLRLRFCCVWVCVGAYSTPRRCRAFGRYPSLPPWPRHFSAEMVLLLLTTAHSPLHG